MEVLLRKSNWKGSLHRSGLLVILKAMMAWTEQRRTGYPQLFKVFVNNSGGAIDTDIRIRRLPYPSDIQKNNPTQYSALKKALGGEDNGGTRLWWDTGRNF